MFVASNPALSHNCRGIISNAEIIIELFTGVLDKKELYILAEKEIY